MSSFCHIFLAGLILPFAVSSPFSITISSQEVKQLAFNSKGSLEMPEPSLAVKKEPVPGNNPAYYTGTPSRDQLFVISEFDIVPNPPAMDQHFFLYLSGSAPSADGLQDSSLKLNVVQNDTENDEPTVIEERLDTFPNLVVRKNHAYGGPLAPGKVELIADFVFPSMFIRKGNYTFSTEASLPDGRVLFSFEGDLHLEGEK